MTTPMMNQWKACKEVAGSALLLFRMGDFYECFHEDAEQAATELEIALTKRQEIPMAGVPWHQVEVYIEKLISKGISVAIAEQVEDPKEAKGLVRREVVRIVTPGTWVTESSGKSSHYLVALAKLGRIWGLAACDLSTAEFRVCEVESEAEVRNELFRLGAKEILLPEKLASVAKGHIVTPKEESYFDHERGAEQLAAHFKVHTLDSFGLKGMGAAIKAAGALLNYLEGDLRRHVRHLIRITPYSPREGLSLDQTTQRTLELCHGPDGGRRGTLLEVIDETLTPMGGRLMASWLKAPLISCDKIRQRQQQVVTFLTASLPAFREMRSALGQIRDLERLTMRISSGYVTPRDFAALRTSLQQLPTLATLLEQLAYSPLDPLLELRLLLERAIVDEPPARLSDGGVFRDYYHPKLTELRALGADSKTYLAEYQQRLREETQIKTLRVGYNRVFGYYLEVSKGQAHLVPSSFIRKQTLANAERFISDELKVYEEKALTAQEELANLEAELFLKLRQEVASETHRLLETAGKLARIDCLVSFTKTARDRRYVKPTVNEADRLDIEGGRHPVIEAQHPGTFVPNDTLLDTGPHSLSLITGPNMAGKSTYLRQVALITILAQMGSFVPATRAEIGVVDKIFTRIGASDNLAGGQSTFMVEMQETANILHNATPRSLIVLDEIGRGTSTYDGISIAWSVAEHLLRRARTLFATHYLELTRLDGAINLHMLVAEAKGEVLFLHKVGPGIADKSYGIHVAKLAGLPLTCIARAQEVLGMLEQSDRRKVGRKPQKRSAQQLALFE